MQKSQSLPGLRRSTPMTGVMTLGASMPPGLGGNHMRKPTLGFRLHHGAVDLLQGPALSPEIKQKAEMLRSPDWRLKAAKEGSRPSTSTPAMLEDVVPKNMRHPREAPAWLKHDKQVLRFYGFFQESVVERPDENSRIRQVVITYHMEDGTLQMIEPKVENSGISQGLLVKRHRVPHKEGGHVGPDDFRCGQASTIYGRTIQICGCDRFTRWFYEENGIDVGEDEPLVEDRWQKQYKMNKMTEKGHLPITNQAMDAKTLTKFQVGQPPADKKQQQFLLNDRKVLRFKGYWDDHTLYGARVYFVIHYYLADNTMDINEAHSKNSGRDNYPGFYKRAPLYKKNSMTAYPGMLSAENEVYMPEDLRVGESMNVWGRNVMLYDCDDFTREFYINYMGVDQAEGRIDVSDKPVRHVKLTPPPHNGIGTEEDSLVNCHMLQPKPPKPDLARLMTLSGESCKYEAKLVNGEPEDDIRRFVIDFMPDTDRVAVYELQSRNSGHMAGKFREKCKMVNPATGKHFKLSDLYVGAVVTICSQPFQIIRADEHCMQYLEARMDEFPFANPAVVARKLSPLASNPALRDQAGIDPDSLRELAAKSRVNLVDHEVVTLLRHFGEETPEGLVVNGPKVLQACLA